MKEELLTWSYHSRSFPTSATAWEHFPYGAVCVPLPSLAGRAAARAVWWPKNSSHSLALLEPVAEARETLQETRLQPSRIPSFTWGRGKASSSSGAKQARSLIRQPCRWRKIKDWVKETMTKELIFFCLVNLDEGEVTVLYCFKGSLLNKKVGGRRGGGRRRRERKWKIAWSYNTTKGKNSSLRTSFKIRCISVVLPPS